MSISRFSIPAFSFRTVPTPLDMQGIRTYLCIVPTTAIPEEFNDWLGVNAREASLRGRVPEKIGETLEETPELFVAYNRGLAILAKDVNYDNQKKKVTLTFQDEKKHGIFDGGHTLKKILDKRESASKEDEEDVVGSYCRIEVMTGVPSELITDLVEARNTSRQVASKSLLNLGQHFEPLKKALGNKMSDKIAWRENEDGVDVREVIALLTALDKTHYDDIQHPIQAYSGKEACLEHFKTHEVKPEGQRCFQKLYPVAKDILKLWDEIQAVVPEQYNKEHGGRFGKLKSKYTEDFSELKATYRKTPRLLPISERSSKYDFPNGYLYPIIGAFRSMLIDEGGSYTWGNGVNPVKVAQEGLATKIFSGPIFNSINQYHNPNRTGKDVNVWALAYQIAENHYLRLGKS